MKTKGKRPTKLSNHISNKQQVEVTYYIYSYVGYSYVLSGLVC